MFKKKNLKKSVVLTSLFAALALIGTGYASWTFSADATDTATGNVCITDATTVGSLTVGTDTVYAVLDENGLSWNTAADGSGSTITTISMTYTGEDAADEKSEVVDFQATYTNGLSAYVTLSGGGTDAFSVDNVSYDGTAIVTVYTLPTLSWVSGMKPMSKQAYDDMVTALSGKTVDFTFTADVK